MFFGAQGIPLGLEPGKKDFQEGMQQVRDTQLRGAFGTPSDRDGLGAPFGDAEVLEQIVAVCKVPNVTSYRKYMRRVALECSTYMINLFIYIYICNVIRAQSARVHLAFSGWIPVVLGGASTTIFRRTQTCDLRPQTPKPFRTLFSKSWTSLCFSLKP